MTHRDRTVGILLCSSTLNTSVKSGEFAKYLSSEIYSSKLLPMGPPVLVTSLKCIDSRVIISSLFKKSESHRYQLRRKSTQ